MFYKTRCYLLYYVYYDDDVFNNIYIIIFPAGK